MKLFAIINKVRSSNDETKILNEECDLNIYT